jgi:GT2 family glycosyltransferase
MPLFSVVIPTCNRNDALMLCLARLAPGEQQGMMHFDAISAKPKLDSSNAYEVIVTDDGSLSTAERMLRERFPWAEWVSGPKRGPAANRNHGAEKAAGDWLVFLDDDCVPEATLLAAYARAAAAGECTVLEGGTLPQGNREAADMECPINASGGRLWSCNFAIKRLVFIELGGFDENFTTAAMEDVDMQTRLSKAGHKTVFVSEASVKHPWRPQKGIKFEHLNAISIAYYVNKHPDHRRYYSLATYLKLGVLVMARDFPKNLFRYKGRGAIRSLLLDLVSVTLIIKYTFRNRSVPSHRCAPEIRSDS